MKKKKLENRKRRPVIVSVMGHVDHGKTSLIDYISKSSLVAAEAGGITQSIRAVDVEYNGSWITFIDTPGHEIFTKLRKRGALISDLILLVIAGDDGVKPQTKEVIDLINKEKSNCLVVITKIDIKEVDTNKIKSELSASGLYVEGYGGNVPVVELSSKTGKGFDELFNMINLISELYPSFERSENINEGFVLESFLEKSSGAMSLVIPVSGRISIGDFIYDEERKMVGKVKSITYSNSTKIPFLPSSKPGNVLGFYEVISSGMLLRFYAEKQKDLTEISLVSEVNNETVEDKQDYIYEEVSGESEPLSFDDVIKTLVKQEENVLPVVLKADYHGSIEAIEDEIKKIDSKIKIKIIKSSTGPIFESDVIFAKSTKAVLIGFNVPVSAKIKSIIKKEKIIYMGYSVIYELVDELVQAAESLIIPDKVELIMGEAEVVMPFVLSNGSFVAGSIVRSGKMVKGMSCYVLRDSVRLVEAKVTFMKHLKTEVKESSKGEECGISISALVKFEKGDRILCYRIEKN